MTDGINAVMTKWRWLREASAGEGSFFSPVLARIRKPGKPVLVITRREAQSAGAWRRELFKLRSLTTTGTPRSPRLALHRRLRFARRVVV